MKLATLAPAPPPLPPALPPAPPRLPHPDDRSASHLGLPPTPYQPRPVQLSAGIPQERWYWVDAASRLAPAAAALGATVGALALATPMGWALGAAWGAGLALGLPALALSAHGAWVAASNPPGPARQDAWRFTQRAASILAVPAALGAGLGLLGPWGWSLGLVAGAALHRATQG